MAGKWTIPCTIDIPIFYSFQCQDINLLWDVIFRNRVKHARMLKDIGVADVLVYFAKSQLLNEACQVTIPPLGIVDPKYFKLLLDAYASFSFNY